MFKNLGRLLMLLTFFISVSNKELSKQKHGDSSTDVAQERDERLLLFATLDGTLTAIEQHSGNIRWKIKEKPIVQVPLDTTNSMPIFLPDPRDGSLYLMGNTREPLKKLPFTIPQLVSSSPCRSSDGILYTGKKKDIWFKLDPYTGNKLQILGWDDQGPTCPVDTKTSVYIGRTKYKIRMVDANNAENRWNVTFYDYAASPMSKTDLNRYDLVHFTSTSSGRLITLDRRRGLFLWDEDLRSPIIGCYLLDPDGLIAVPFTSLANHTIHYLFTQMSNLNGILQNPNHMKLYPTLYIGEHVHGLYALPSLVDQSVVTITPSDWGPLLLGGPNAPERPKLYPEYPLPGHNYHLPKDFYKEGELNFQSLPNFGDHVIIFTGHYNVPQFSNQRFIGASTIEPKLLTDQSSQSQYKSSVDNKKVVPKPKSASVGVQTEFIKKLHIEIVASGDRGGWVKKHYGNIKIWINRQENKGLKLSLIVMTGCVIAMFWYLRIQVREMQNISQNGSGSTQIGSYGQNSMVTAISEELPNGLVKVGKITFHPEQLLGKGCEGTFVYRGEFDNRRVAVKRLLPECFTFADREVALLRESDAHPNVIRYYCMEQDRMFRYIALELCQATLSDYVQGHVHTSAITPLEILQQATLGLSHLHSLDIVHRDIKPHNVLLSVPNSSGEVKAMISDFGLCKKLQVGKVSFSRRSGVTGTDGWIAPEMLNGSERTTYAVDLFSLGCLFYYVLSEGSHPFGDALRRQGNILSGEFDLSELKGTDWQVNLQVPLLSALISSKPENRPSCRAVLKHPMFWTYSKILSFFQDVSDRIEKAQADDPVLQALECNGEQIVKIDWRVHIHKEVASDLRKYRTYQGKSVRDLLRALRNKKHHFRELSIEAQTALGDIPEAFTNYWLNRFPLLLVYTWITMQDIAHEKTFKNYYYQTHKYSLENFRQQVNSYTVKHPVEIPNLIAESEFPVRFKEPINKINSFPKQSKITGIDFKKSEPTGSQEDRNEYKSGGLYRNLTTNEKTFPLDKINSTYKGNLIKRSAKSRKKVDEPLIWRIAES